MPQPTSLAVSLLLALAGAEAKGDDVAQVDARNATIVTAQAGKQSGGHLSADGRVRDLLNHPAFAGFSRLLLPWDNRAYDEDMRLSDLGALLPYHSHVTPRIVVGALNRMIDDASDGKPIFYDLYSAAQKKAQPAKANAGLFFFRGKPGAPFAVISPGGGFAYVGSIHEGFPYAEAISAQGYNAFVLRYRAGYGGAVATEDLAAAISFIVRNAEKLGVSTEQLFSVGELGRRKDGSRHRYARRRGVWRRRSSEAVRRGDGLYGAFGLLVERAADLCRRGRSGRHSAAVSDGKAGGRAAQRRCGRRISRVQKFGSRLRSWDRDERRRMDRRSHSVLGKVCRQQELGACFIAGLPRA